jgi:hypothetical protein
MLSMRTACKRIRFAWLGVVSALATSAPAYASVEPAPAAAPSNPPEPNGVPAATGEPLPAVASPPSEAEPAPPEPTSEKSDFGGELRGAMGFGGEKVAEVQYSDGSSSDLSLGTYFFLGVGGIYSPWRWNRMGVELELLAGWASWSTGPENTKDRVQLGRFPIEALAYYRHLLSDTPDGEMLLRVGGGVSYHLIGGLSGSGSLEDVELDFDNALGGVLEGAFVYTAFAGGVRYLPMKYRTSADGHTLDASSLSFFLSLQLEPGL